jgi:hypothetical protein
MAAFLLAFNGEPIEKHAIKKLITESKSFGTKTGNHFLCEFYPLPKKGLGCWPVEFEPLYPNESKYYEIIAPKRFSLLLDQISHSEKLRLIICYNKAILNVPGLKDIIEDPIETFIGTEKYVLYNLKAKNKNVKLLITPFFGNGRISYNGIAKVVEELSLNTIFSN